MRRPPKTNLIVESVDTLSAAIADFDYGVDPDDFILYELGRMIEEDRVSFDDEEFRRLIDGGIRRHVEENLTVRARLAGVVRMAVRKLNPETRDIARRVIHALEDTSCNLRDAGVVVRTYTAYLFDRLQAAEDDTIQQDNARDWITRWKYSEIPRETLLTELKGLGRSAVGPAADLLFEADGDRTASEVAITVLSSIGSAVSARVLAHAVSEPMLEEDLEARAFAELHRLWPLGRDYMLYSLASHAHEDLPFRWFELFVEVDELLTVELILEELFVHAENPDYREDLAALLAVLVRTRDPDGEDKIVAMINTPGIPAAAGSLLLDLLKEYRPANRAAGERDTWAGHTLLLELNGKYIAAAKLADMGRAPEALRALDEILAANPDYPFALMLKSVMERPSDS